MCVLRFPAFCTVLTKNLSISAVVKFIHTTRNKDIINVLFFCTLITPSAIVFCIHGFASLQHFVTIDIFAVFKL